MGTRSDFAIVDSALANNSDESLHSEDAVSWLQWGPYMSNREWGTVRETATREGQNWQRLPYEKANQTAYRYCEDGIFGVCDSECRLCHSYAFWNYRDSHLKERFFGVTNDQGTYGEDVKEMYFYRAADKHYRYLSAEYIYPQIEFPYQHLVNFERALKSINEASDLGNPSAVVNLTDMSNWYDDHRFFEIEFEMCKLTPDQLCFQISVTNRWSEAARIIVMPMLFLRNTWTSAWLSGEDVKVEKVIKPGENCLHVNFTDADNNQIWFHYYYEAQVVAPEILLTHNASRDGAVGKQPGKEHYKDVFNNYILSGDSAGLVTNLDGSTATKAGICYRLRLAPQQQVKLRSFLVLTSGGRTVDINWSNLAATIEAMKVKQMVDSYKALPNALLPLEQDILVAAYTTLLWNRQFYPLDRMTHLWRQTLGLDLPTRLVTVPDKWEQPYLATWDAAVHCLVLNCFDRKQAVKELMLLLSLIRLDGSIFNDEYRPHGVTPPLIVLAAIDVYGKCTATSKFNLGPRLYFCLRRHLRWWLHRKDARGVELIDGGVCGVDYVSLFPREFLETGEGIIWAIFFLMRFLELTLAIYDSPGCPISTAIQADLPDYLHDLGRLCSIFVQCVSQKNGLYHPTWLDIIKTTGCAGCVEPLDACEGESTNPPSRPMVRADSTSSEEWEASGCRGPRVSRASDASDLNDEGVAGTVGAAGVTNAPPKNEDSAPTKCHVNKEGTNMCGWIHAYCYLPVICCCSLPNTRLRGKSSYGDETLEDLLARSFNGPLDWETRAPYIYADRAHNRLFVSVLNTLQLTELLEQLLSEVQFLGQYGIRTMSMLHTCDDAVVSLKSCQHQGQQQRQGEQGSYSLWQKFCSGPSESCSYGGNTNWYGGVNLPYNYLVIESLHKWSTVLNKKCDLFEYPSYTGRYCRLEHIAKELAKRNVALFLPNANGIIPSTGDDGKRGLLMFETFDGDSGRGHGARHKGGWSSIIARTLLLMQDLRP